jgi:predicted amidophosphoribosyltransferase
MTKNAFWDAFGGATASISHDGACGYCKTAVGEYDSICPHCGSQWRLTFRFFGTRLSYVILLVFLYMVLRVDPPLSYALVPAVFVLLLAVAERKTEWVYPR